MCFWVFVPWILLSCGEDNDSYLQEYKGTVALVPPFQLLLFDIKENVVEE